MVFVFEARRNKEGSLFVFQLEGDLFAGESEEEGGLGLREIARVAKYQRGGSEPSAAWFPTIF